MPLWTINKKELEGLKKITLYENIGTIEERSKSDSMLSRDLTCLAPMVAKNSEDNFGSCIQCLSIVKMIPNDFYSKVCFNVKTRLINLLCSLEDAGVDIDKCDVRKSKYTVNFDNQNDEMFKTVVVDNKSFSFVKNIKPIFWKIAVPILVGIVTTVVSAIITHYLF